MCTKIFWEIFFRKIWYLLGNTNTMLRKANETKRQIIESLNKRLLNENESIDSKLESIVKDAHSKMIIELNKLLEGKDGSHLVDQRFHGAIISKIEKSEDELLKFLLTHVQQEMDRMEDKRKQ